MPEMYSASGSATFAHRLGETDPVPYPDVERLPVTFKPGKLARPIPNHHALYDRTSDKFFSIVSPQYEIVNHQDISNQLEEVMDQRNLKPTIRTDFEGYGNWMRKTYVFDSEKYDLGDGDTVSPRLYFFNGYDRRTQLRLDLGAFRWVCSNGQVSGERFFQMIQQHRGVIDFRPEDLDNAFDKFSDQVTQWIGWREQPAIVEDYTRLVDSVQPTKSGQAWIESKVVEETGSPVEKHEKTQEVIGIPEMTYWILYNVLTAYVTHAIQSQRLRAQAEMRLRRALRPV